MPITEQGLKQARKLGLYPERFEVIESMLNRWVKEEIPSVTTAVVRDGIPVFMGAYGMGGPDPEGLPLRSDSIFQVASITKPFIATCLMLLLEDGEIDLNDPVKRFIPEFDSDDRSMIAIWHLLTHTSGLSDDFQRKEAVKFLKEELGLELNDDNWSEIMAETRVKMGWDGLDERETWKRLQRSTKPAYQNRKVMEYCNMGYEICKDIIVKVTDEPIDVFARRRIFDPLGMDDTYWVLPESKWNRVVRRGEGVEGYPWFNEEDSYINESGAGGLKTTAIDVVKFTEMIRQEGSYNGNRIMSPITVKGMVKNHNTTFGEWDAWTLGFNYHGTKSDDMGIVRSETSIDHGGYGGTRILIDKENRLSWSLFAVNPFTENNIYAKFTNMVYSCFD